MQLAVGMGAAVALLGLYGLIGPYCCAGESVRCWSRPFAVVVGASYSPYPPPPPGFCGCLQDSHVKVFVFFGLLVFFVVSVTAVVTMLNADDQDGITEGLDFGWHKCVALPPALATALHGRCIT